MESARTDLAWLVGLLLASAGLPRGVAAVLHLGGVAGTDPALWTLSALDLEQGLEPTLSPLYPALIALLHTGTGPAVSEGAQVTALATALVGPLTYLLARALRAGPAMAGLVAGVALTSPAVAGFSVRISPDALVVGAFLGVSLAAVGFARHPESAWRLLILVALGAVAPLLRVHGVLLTASVAAVLALAPGRPSQRLLRLALLLVAALAAPLLVGLWPALPWHLLWNGRLLQPMRDTLGEVPKYAAVLRPALYARLAALYAAGDRLGIVLFHAEWALRQDPGTWAAVLAALVSLLRLPLRDRAVAVGLLPVLPALLIWSAPRHVGVALPVALAVLTAAWSPTWRGTRSRWGVRLAAGALLLLVWGRWPVLADALGGEAKGIGMLREVGRVLCERAGPGDFAAGEAEAFLFCPLPVNRPTPQGRAADWHTWWVVLASPRGSSQLLAPSLPWARVWLEVPDRFAVYRLAPWVGRRPCAEATPVRPTRYFSPAPWPAPTAPRCQVDPWSFGPAPGAALEGAR